jgi:hypothetical protein
MILNWNVDEKKFKKENPEKYKLWRLEQLINYGGEKISKSEVIANWEKIKDKLDIDARKTIEFFIWGKKWKAEPGLRADRKNFWSWLRKKKISELNSTSRVEQLCPRST